MPRSPWGTFHRAATALLCVGLAASSTAAPPIAPPTAGGASRPSTPAATKPAAVAGMIVVLEAREAKLSGGTDFTADDPVAGLRVGHWKGDSPAASWLFNVAAGDYTVDVTYGCESASVGGACGVAVAGSNLKCEIRDTGSWRKLRTDRLGTVRHPGGLGRVVVTMVRPPPAESHGLMHLRKVVLTPVGMVAPATTGPAPTPRAKAPQATVKGLVVIDLGSGRYAGKAVGIVATSLGSFANGRVNVRGKVGESMLSAAKEAERYLRVSHPRLRDADVEISFEDRYSAKDGGSAGTAFAVVLQSVLEGFQIDPDVSMTGDIAVNGKVQPIGGVTAKLRGSRADGCKYTVIPKANVPAVGDLMVAADKVDMLADLQVFSVDTVDDAIAVARRDRDPKLTQAISLYAEVQGLMASRRLAALREPATQAMLEKVLTLAPNHVSARYALDIGRNKGPRTLTRNASVIEVFNAAEPFYRGVMAWDARKDGKPITRQDLPVVVAKQVQKNLVAIRLTIHPDVEEFRKASADWIDAVDRQLSATKAISKPDAQMFENRRLAFAAAIRKLGSDESTVEKMSREGY